MNSKKIENNGQVWFDPDEFAKASELTQVGSDVSALQVTTESVADTITSKELVANKVITFAYRTSDLTITLPSSVIAKDEFHFFIVSGGTPTITWPQGISWVGGNAPTIASGKTYEVSIMNNIAICLEI